MGIVVNTNISALNAQNYLSNNQVGLSKAIQRLSSGLRINNAADDPAGLAISVSMQQTSSALATGAQNANNGISLVQTAEAAMKDISTILTTMSTLASQAASGTYSSTQLGNLNTQFNALLNEINRVAENTQFNGITLLNGSSASLTIQVGSGATSNDQLTINLTELTTGTAGLSISSLDISTSGGATTAITSLTSAINSVTTALAGLGANQSNLEAAASVDTSLATSLNAAKSRIEDADFAAESSNLAKYNVLTQSSIAMLAQANSLPQQVLRLVQG